jgi:chloride channel protein, CIC family
MTLPLEPLRERAEPAAEAEARPCAAPPVTQEREFWALLGCAVALGVFGGFASLAVLGVIDLGSGWYTDTSPGWFGGHWWWVAITAAAGTAVGLIRQLSGLPKDVPGLFDDLRTQHVDPRLVPGTMAASVVSLMCGASLGPEKVLGTLGGGVGTWLVRRRGLGGENAQVSALTGIAGIFGGLFSSPVIVVLLILEIARPGGRRFSKTLVTNIAAGSISFGIYFAIAGAVFLGAYRIPPYGFEDWQLLAAVPLGLFAALVTTLTSGFTTLASHLFDRLEIPAIAKTTLGGVIFGIVGAALPLTMFSGGDQLSSMLKRAQTLGLGLCVTILLAKTLTYGISQGSGFVGGPIFPSLFIGGAAGIVVNQAIPSVPLGLAFGCLLTAVLGSLAAAPLSMVLMAGFLTRGGALQTAPVLIAVVTTFLAVEGLKYSLTSHGHTRTPVRAP